LQNAENTRLTGAIFGGSMPQQITFTPAQETMLRNSFMLFDINQDGLLSVDDIGRFARAMGIDYASPDELFRMANGATHGGVNYGAFKELIIAQIKLALRKDSNYFMLISLQEAEHLRCMFHARKGRSLLPSEMALAGKFSNARMWALSDVG
jgi:hypothetical protein